MIMAPFNPGSRIDRAVWQVHFFDPAGTFCPSSAAGRHQMIGMLGCRALIVNTILSRVRNCKPTGDREDKDVIGMIS
jgi:hypothetical protein